MLFYCMDLRYYQKKFANFQQNSIVYYFFFIFLSFCFLFHLSKLVQKLWIFWSVLLEGLKFYQRFQENFESCFKKNIDMWNIFFSKFWGLVFVFLFFYYFWHFIFNFVYLYLSKNTRNFYVFLILLIRNFIKEFWKIMEYFSKKYRHLKSNILHKFHHLLFVFLIFLAFC